MRVRETSCEGGQRVFMVVVKGCIGGVDDFDV